MRALSLLIGVTLAGCASSENNLQVATASLIGGGLAPSEVVVTNVERGVLDVHWTAMANGRAYSCSADDMVGRHYCVRQ